jgi:two-component system OmpR family sensor kinase
MGGLVEDLLELARIDEAKPLVLAPVDLLSLAADAALDAMASSPGRSVSVVAAPTEPVGGGEASEAAPPSTGEREPALVGPPSARSATSGTERTAPAGSISSPISFAGAALARLRTRRPKRVDATAPASEAVPVSPSPLPQAVVMAEENKLRQVLTNLMGNALRYTRPDSPVELEVAVDPSTQRASIAIIDHGEGIPPQIREKIFQRFWRADTSRARETGGSGLGLAIVASIVASHNGTVEVVDTPGGGATFRVWLPLAGSPGAPQRMTPSGV